MRRALGDAATCLSPLGGGKKTQEIFNTELCECEAAISGHDHAVDQHILLIEGLPRQV